MLWLSTSPRIKFLWLCTKAQSSCALKNKKVNSSQDTFLVAAGQCLEDSRGCIFSSHVPRCDSSKHMKCKSKFLLRELDEQEEQQACSSCSLQQSFERKYTFKVGRAGMQLPRLVSIT